MKQINRIKQAAEVLALRLAHGYSRDEWTKAIKDIRKAYALSDTDMRAVIHHFDHPGDTDVLIVREVVEAD